MPHNYIFLSHKGTDKNIVREYRDTLIAFDLKPWLDETEMVAGSPLVRTLSDGMARSCAAVFFVTPDYDDTGYLGDEINNALREKVERGNAFSIIILAFRNDHGRIGKIPEPLRKYVWKEPRGHLEGLRFIVEALPPHVWKITRGFLPLPDLVPTKSKEIILIGQNLAGRLGLNEHKYQLFLNEINSLLNRDSTKEVILMVMTPKALNAIHPAAAQDLRKFSYPRLLQLSSDLKEDARTKVRIAFHPSATLSALAVDWSEPDDAFAMITPKFQRTESISDRFNIMLDSQHFDTASVNRMLYDAERESDGAIVLPLSNAPEFLDQLLLELGL